MGYIYCIVNLYNKKKYVGKTITTIEERFQEHYTESQKTRHKNRPLYKAFNKYGIDNFIVGCIEEVENDKLSDREIFWIEVLNTYGKNGYNATKGGDGKILYDHDKIIKLYNNGYNCIQVSKMMKCHVDTVIQVLRNSNIVLRNGNSKKILQYDLNGNFIQEFWGSTEAAKWLVNNGIAKSLCCKSHITDCCNLKTTNAYKYIWKYSV